MKHSARAVARQSRAGDAGPGSRLLAQLPYWLVLAGLVAGLAVMRGGAESVRSGTLVIGCAFLAGALTRLLLPEGRVGMLRTRARLVDVVILTGLGAGLLVAGLIVKLTGS